MPNAANITAPVTLLGIGRSGTSLIGASFGIRPDFSDCAETGGLIFGVWEGAKQSFVPHPPQYWTLFSEDNNEKSAYFVREAIKAALPSDEQYWFHKPAGLPMTFLDWNKLPGERSPVTNFPVEWYWTVFLKTFPESRFVTVFRDPFDVALSRADLSGWETCDTLKAIVQVYEIIQYGWDNFQSIVVFDDLIVDFEGTMRKMCADIKIPFDPLMTKAIEHNHSPVAQRSYRLNHKERWPELSRVRLKRAEIEVLERVWERLGRNLIIPIRSTGIFGFMLGR
mgnify:CR=1 FL=1